MEQRGDLDRRARRRLRNPGGLDLTEDEGFKPRWLPFHVYAMAYLCLLAGCLTLYEVSGNRADTDAAYRDYYSRNLTVTPHGLQPAGKWCQDANLTRIDCPYQVTTITPIDRDPVNWWSLHFGTFIAWWFGSLVTFLGVCLSVLGASRFLDARVLAFQPPFSNVPILMRYMMPVWMVLCGIIWTLIVRGYFA